MKMMRATGSRLLLAVILMGMAAVRGFVVAPPRISSRSIAREAGISVPRAAGAEPREKKR